MKKILSCLLSVSYTHLDVYKRQILPAEVRRERGQAGGGIFHAGMRGKNAGGGAPALQRAGVRPLLRQRRHVRAVGEIRGKPRREHQ